MKNRVARYQADRTNQKLYFTRIYCQLAEQEQEGQIQDAHIESALFHLHGSYLAFLQEIARFYQINITEPTLNSIQTALEERTQVSPEVLRLQKLLQHDFLAEIEQAWHLIIFKPSPTQIPSQTTDVRRLPIIDVMANPQSQKLTTDLVRQWRYELVEVIESLREGMVEF